MTSGDQVNPSTNEQKRIRLVRPSIVVLCGAAACGKSSFAAHHFRSTQVISSDRARALVCDDERDQRFQAQAFALLHFLIEQRLSLNRLCVVDSTALTQSARRSLIDLARKYQVPCTVILFNVPLEVCVARDQARERSVGRAVIEHQFHLFEQARASIKDEGFNQIFELRDENLGQVTIEVMFRPVSRRFPATAPRPPYMRRPARPPETVTGDRRVLPVRPSAPVEHHTVFPSARPPAQGQAPMPTSAGPATNSTPGQTSPSAGSPPANSAKGS